MITQQVRHIFVMSSMDYARDFAKRNGSTQYEKLLTKLDELKDQLMKMEKLRIVPDEIGWY